MGRNSTECKEKNPNSLATPPSNRMGKMGRTCWRHEATEGRGHGLSVAMDVASRLAAAVTIQHPLIEIKSYDTYCCGEGGRFRGILSDNTIGGLSALLK
jgi:hypothetical protein